MVKKEKKEGKNWIKEEMKQERKIDERISAKSDVSKPKKKESKPKHSKHKVEHKKSVIKKSDNGDWIKEEMKQERKIDERISESAGIAKHAEHHAHHKHAEHHAHHKHPEHKSKHSGSKMNEAQKEAEVERELDEEIEVAEKKLERIEHKLNGESLQEVDIQTIQIVASRPIEQVKKGDKIKIDGVVYEVDAHSVLIDHGSTKEMAIDCFESKSDKDYQLRYFSDQVERTMEFYELQEIMYVKKVIKKIEW